MKQFVFSVWNALRFAFGRSGKQDELDEEVRFHIEGRIDELMEQGHDRKTARNMALKEFGGMNRFAEECRDAWGTRVVTDLIRDVSFSLRLLKRNAKSTAMAIAVMAIGFGVSATIFTAVNGILFSDLDIPEPDRLLHMKWQGVRYNKINVRDFRVFRDEMKDVAEIAAFSMNTLSVRSYANETYAERYRGCRVSRGFFDTVGVGPIRGSGFTDSEDAVSGLRAEAIISYRLWQNLFEGDESIVGSHGYFDGASFDIVGVMPETFLVPKFQDFWLLEDWKYSDAKDRSSAPAVEVIGRLRPNISVSQLNSGVQTIASRLASEFPSTNENNLGLALNPLRKAFSSEKVVSMLLPLLGFGVLILCVACVNVFNIMLMQTAKRSFELTVRRCMGATRSSIIFQVIIDGFIISFFGAGLGLVMASYWTSIVWANLSQRPLPQWYHMDLGLGVVAFVAFVLVLTTIASSVFPALRATKSDSFELLKDSARTSSGLFVGRLSRFLVGAQITVSVAMLVCAFVMIEFLDKSKGIELSFEPDSVIMAQLQLGGNGEYETDSSTIAYYRNLQDSLMALQGIDDVGFSSSRSGLFGTFCRFKLDGADNQNGEPMSRSSVHVFTDNVFEILGLDTLSGRTFNSFDTAESQQVCVVDKRFADQFSVNENPVGKRIFLEGGSLPRNGWKTIIGVVDNISKKSFPDQRNGIIVPFSQAVSQQMTCLLSSDGEAMRWSESLRDAIHKLDPNIAPTRSISTVQEPLDRKHMEEELLTSLFIVFGLAGIFKSFVGLYGVVAFSTRERSKEFGIRLAVGASSYRLVLAVVAQGGRQVIVGLVLGVAIGYAITQLMLSLMNANEESLTFLPYIAVILTVCASCIGAMGFPAWSATRVDPTKALKMQ